MGAYAELREVVTSAIEEMLLTDKEPAVGPPSAPMQREAEAIVRTYGAVDL